MGFNALSFSAMSEPQQTHSSAGDQKRDSSLDDEQWQPPQGPILRAAVWVVLILILLAVVGMIIAVAMQ